MPDLALDIPIWLIKLLAVLLSLGLLAFLGLLAARLLRKHTHRLPLR